MFLAVHDINGHCNEHRPLTKNVTGSDCWVSCLVMSHLVRTESPQGLPFCYTHLPISVNRVLSSLKWAKEKKKINVLKYVDMYIHMSFLNSQSTPWSKASCRQSGTAEKNYQKSPPSLFPLPPSTHSVSALWPQPSHLLLPSLFLTRWLALFRHLCLNGILNACATSCMNICFFKLCFHCKVKAVFFHSGVGGRGGTLYRYPPRSLKSDASSAVGWPWLWWVGAWVPGGGPVHPVLMQRLPLESTRHNEDSSQLEKTSVQGHCSCVNATAPLLSSWTESRYNYCD